MDKEKGLAVVFVLDERRFALPLPMVEQVVRAVAVTPLPRAPAVVQGILDFHGRIVPVMDIRLRLGLPPRATALSDQLIIARTPRRAIALGVERIAGVMEWDAKDFAAAAAVLPGVEFLGGVVRNRDGLILVYDPDALFLPDEHLLLEQAIGEVAVDG